MKTQLNRNGLIRLALVGVIGLAFLIGLAEPAHADIEDILLEKGTITKEDWLKIKADKEKAPATSSGSGMAPTSKGPRPPTPPVGGGNTEKAKTTDYLKGVDVGLTVYANF